VKVELFSGTHRAMQCPSFRLLRSASVFVLLPFLVATILLLSNTALLHAQDATGTYTVQPGDSLSAIAASYGVSLDALVAANSIADPSLIRVGQVLIIPGATTVSGASLPGVPVSLVRAHAGDTIASVAQRFAQDPATISALNGLTTTATLFPGQPVRLPEAAAPQEEVRFGAITAIDLPSSIEQGRTGHLVIESSRPLTVTAIWNGLQLPLAPLDSMTRVAALLPAPALIELGDYPLTVSYTTLSGLPVQREFAIPIVDGGYENQIIAFTPEVGALLEPTLVQSELQKVASVTRSFTADMVQRTPFQRPIGVEYGTTSPFGIRRYYDSDVNSMAGYHAGQDFGAGTGVPILAPSAGIVALAEPLQVRGNAVILDHGRGVYTGYWHMSQINVTPGQLVQTGDVLGLVGTTGLSTGSHLHWEMQVYGIPVDPMQFLNEAPFP